MVQYFCLTMYQYFAYINVNPFITWPFGCYINQ